MKGYGVGDRVLYAIAVNHKSNSKYIKDKHLYTAARTRVAVAYSRLPTDKIMQGTYPLEDTKYTGIRVATVVECNPGYYLEGGMSAQEMEQQYTLSNGDSCYNVNIIKVLECEPTLLERVTAGEIKGIKTKKVDITVVFPVNTLLSETAISKQLVRQQYFKRRSPGSDSTNGIKRPKFTSMFWDAECPTCSSFPNMSAAIIQFKQASIRLDPFTKSMSVHVKLPPYLEGLQGAIARQRLGGHLEKKYTDTPVRNVLLSKELLSMTWVTGEDTKVVDIFKE